MIRKCTKNDFEQIYHIINTSAQAYKGVIPEDRWHEPYMGKSELEKEIQDGVIFWGEEQSGCLAGVMGVQDKGDVTLIRHAYVEPELRNKGIGTKLLNHLETLTDKPILIGTWADASWAVSFYRKNGYRVVAREEKNKLLKTFWSIPERQVETSVVLAGNKWKSNDI
jgi:GNAT superfamily N-acetyltransferase